MPIRTWCYIPTSLPQEQAAKYDMLSVVSIQVLCTVEGVANACIWLTQPPWSWKCTTLAEYKCQNQSGKVFDKTILYLEILDYVPRDYTILYLDIVDSIHKQVRGWLQNLYQLVGTYFWYSYNVYKVFSLIIICKSLWQNDPLPRDFRLCTQRFDDPLPRKCRLHT